MSYRFMRVMVFFDLPTETAQDRRDYARFRKHLIKKGFFMMQESVYCKIVLNATAQAQLLDDLRKHKPHGGLVQVLSVTERQYSRMEFIVGEYHGDIINSDERLIEL